MVIGPHRIDRAIDGHGQVDVGGLRNIQQEPHRRWLEDDGSLRDRDDAAAMRIADPGWGTPSVPRW
ncbi:MULTISPECIES: hypothetical protein [unclassified Streptomyces]|uniref:hypothetical protein n=1 Tax=unclassified Streptomyces TaxID=2593676 RepID=UPI0023654971|nr:MULTISPECIES: hypothetical protein [unclassified Streptomyces]MDF3148678.1 hypothetical protein [Streptomyces sp. T21Q-yed]WDF37995.1 hypothetical protein PBV52_14910 [Streptomyces sp. T12]